MANLVKDGHMLTGDIAITKKGNTVLTLDTYNSGTGVGTYVDGDIQFTIHPILGEGVAGTASADSVIESTDGSAAGINISGSIGTKQSSEPSSGYYIRVKATGSGGSVIQTAGWMDDGPLPAASTTSTSFYPVTAGTITVSGGTATKTDYTGTPTLNIGIASQTTTGATVVDAQPSSGYYVTLSGTSTSFTGTTSVSITDVKDTRAAGYIPARSATTIYHLDTQSPTVTINAGSKTKYLTIPSGSVTQGNLSLNSTTGVVSGAVSISEGYVAADSLSKTLQLTTMSGATKYATTSNQTVSTTGKFMLGDIVVSKLTATSFTEANIKHGVNIKINNGSTNVFNKTGTFTSDGTITAADIRNGKIGYSQGEAITGNMPDSAISQGKTTVSGQSATRGTYSWTAGYTTAHTLSAATFGNEAASSTTYVDISNTTSAPVLVSGDYLYINKGYTDNLKISLAKLVPDGSDVKNHGDYLLSGHSAYDDDGTLVAGTIPTLASTDITVNENVVTVPLGKYTGAADGTSASVTIPPGDYTPSVTSGGTNTAAAFTPSVTGTVTDITTGTAPSGTDGTDYWTITPSGSKTTGKARAKATATIGTAGYIAAGSKTTSSYSTWNITTNVNAGTASYIPKAVIAGASTNASATTTVAPGTVSVTKQAVPSGVTQAASGDATTDAPSSGVYVAVKATAAANTAGTTSSISGSGSATVTTAGYAPTTLTGNISVSGTATAKTSAKDSLMTYVPITTTSATVSGKTVSYGSGWITEGSKSVADGDYSASVTSHTISTVPVVTGSTSGTITNISSTTTPSSGTDGTDYWTITPGGSVTTTGVSSTKAKATISTAGYIVAGEKVSSADTKNITPSVLNGTARYIPKAVIAGASTNASGTGTCAPGAVTITTYSTTITNKTRVAATATTSNTFTQPYFVAVTASAAANTTGSTFSLSGSGTASVTTAGYAPATLTGSVTVSGTGTAKTSKRDSSVYYVPLTAGALTATVSSNSGGSASMAATGFTAASSATSYYITLSTSAGSVKAKATVGTEGYVKTESNETAATSVAVSGNGDKLYIPAGAYSAGSTTYTNSTVTPSVSISNATTYGFTTDQPSGTYVTVDPNATATSWSVTPNATVGTAGYVPAGTVNGTAVSATPSIAAGTNYYVPVRTVSFSGGGVTVTNNFTKSDLALTLQSGSDTNMTNVTVGAKDTSTYPYYFKVAGSTPAVTGSTTVTRAAATYSNSAGLIAAHSGAAIWDAATASPTVSVNATSSGTYVGLKKATATITGTNTVSPSAALTSSNVTLGTTNNGISVTATGGGTASVSAVATTNATGYAPSATQLGTATLSASSTTTTATKYVTAITVPTAQTFSVTTAANTTSDSKALTVTNNAYRTTNITNAANGVITVANSGSATVTSGSGPAGTLSVNAYNNATTPALTGTKTIVSAGKWQTQTPTSAGTYYGCTVLTDATVTPSFANTNISTYFNSGTSSSNSISITPNYTNTAGAMPAHTSAQNGTTSYYTIKTASPTFSAAPTGSSTATSSSATISSSTNNSGVSIQTKYAINAVDIKYSAAATGWINKAANADTGSDTSATASTNGTLYYINDVTMATPSSGTRTFAVIAPDGTGNHTYTFSVDSAGKTRIDVDTTLTMQWNNTNESLEFIYT